jgi:hypothetical protein
MVMHRWVQAALAVPGGAAGVLFVVTTLRAL